MVYEARREAKIHKPDSCQEVEESLVLFVTPIGCEPKSITVSRQIVLIAIRETSVLVSTQTKGLIEVIPDEKWPKSMHSWWLEISRVFTRAALFKYHWNFRQHWRDPSKTARNRWSEEYALRGNPHWRQAFPKLPHVNATNCYYLQNSVQCKQVLRHLEQMKEHESIKDRDEKISATTGTKMQSYLPALHDSARTSWNCSQSLATR